MNPKSAINLANQTFKNLVEDMIADLAKQASIDVREKRGKLVDIERPETIVAPVWVVAITDLAQEAMMVVHVT